MYFLIYISAATHEFTQRSLHELTRGSERNNSRDGVTGMLLFRRGNFLQVLEGDEAAVLATYGRISLDSRHSGLITLMQGTQRERQFPKWCMGFNDLDSSAPKPQGFADFIDLTLSGGDFLSAPGKAQRLLKIFRAHSCE